MQNAEFEKSRRFYENYVAPMIHEKFPKWTYRALSELDNEGEYTMLIKKLASTLSDDASWRFVTYNPRSINMKDKVIATAEEIAKALVILLRNNNLIEGNDAYLEIYINEILK